MHREPLPSARNAFALFPAMLDAWVCRAHYFKRVRMANELEDLQPALDVNTLTPSGASHISFDSDYFPPMYGNVSSYGFSFHIPHKVSTRCNTLTLNAGCLEQLSETYGQTV
jgi:hypothetical protein